MNANAPRIGDWMGMANGRRFWPLDPRAAEVDVDEIANALANLCRFGGRCRPFYSVAQHCLWVADQCATMWPDDSWLHVHALLHDAAEAFVGDVVSPLKPFVHVLRNDRFEAFRDTEERVMRAIRAKLVLPTPTPLQVERIRAADVHALATEARDLMGNPQWPGLPDTDAEPLEPVGPGEAAVVYARVLRELLADVGGAA